MGVASDASMEPGRGGGGCCCSPQAFTSGVLGALACLLVTGGVFLAFHRWDPLWLVVSAVGALLALVGSLLHCCADQQRPPPQHKGGPQPLPTAAVMPEQLVPLSNARSVSQLSLNMLPGYFPPVVAAYGIEQHSAVVQNIVGQQQQRGAKLLLLSLPDHTPQASLHSLVAAVYQLDGNVLTDIPSIPENNTPPVATPPVQLQPPQPVFKHAEVQTTTAWPTSSQPSTSLNLLDTAPICDNLPPTDQVLIPLRQEALVSSRAAPDAHPEFLERRAHPLSSGTAEVSVSTETQISPTSSVSTNTQILPRSSRSGSSRGPSGSRRSSAGTRRSTRSDARRPSAPADMQTPSTSSASTSASMSTEPTTQEQISTRSDVNASLVTNVTPRMIEVSGTSRDGQTALKSVDTPSYSNPVRNEMPSTSSDTQCILNTNAQESVRSSNVQVAQDRSETQNEVPTATQTSSRPSEGTLPDLSCSVQVPEVSSEVLLAPSNESFANVAISSEVPLPPEVEVSTNPGTSHDNVTPIHCRLPANESFIEVPMDNAPIPSTSSSVLIDITESAAISSTSTGLNSERLLDESLLGAIGGASSELSLSDLDEAEIMERSSPPPSYDDVTHERDGSFALAYGTI